MKFCSLYSGSSGNCLYLEDKNVKILIDAGLSGKKIESALKEMHIQPEEIDAILVSHDHQDHIKGAGVISRRYNIPIYANEGTWSVAAKGLGKISEENIKVFKTEECVFIDDLCIFPFEINHDAKEPVGFTLENTKKKISIVTDTGIITEDILGKIMDSDLVIIESNHDIEMVKVGRYPYYLKRRVLSNRGHLSNDDAAKTILNLVEHGLKNVLLAHLSEENNFPELAFETTRSLLSENNITVNADVVVEVASRFYRSSIFNI